MPTTRAQWRDQDLLQLNGVHPQLRLAVAKIQTAMEALGFPMTVTDGVRTDEEQKRLYAQGRSVPGKIVTNADGVVKRSNHQTKNDGLGHAVDMAFLVRGSMEAQSGVDKWTVSWEDALPWGLFGACAKAVRLKWGGDWQALSDRPHIELP